MVLLITGLPHAGCLKLNVDAAISRDNSSVFVGGAVRDSSGVVVGVLCKKLMDLKSPLMPECMALKAGLGFVFWQRWSINSAETDYKML